MSRIISRIVQSPMHMFFLQEPIKIVLTSAAQKGIGLRQVGVLLCTWSSKFGALKTELELKLEL